MAGPRVRLPPQGNGRTPRPPGHGAGSVTGSGTCSDPGAPADALGDCVPRMIIAASVNSMVRLMSIMYVKCDSDLIRAPKYTVGTVDRPPDRGSANILNYQRHAWTPWFGWSGGLRGCDPCATCAAT